MGNVFYFDWEIKLIEWFQSFNVPFIGNSSIFSSFGAEYIMILILGLIYWCINKDLGRKVALCVCSSMSFGTLIKAAVLRRRPYMDNESIKCIKPAHDEGDIMNPSIQGYSLPSLHSTMTTSLFGMIYKNIKNNIFKIICILIPLIIGLSRIYLGVHYPTDVILGWTLGLLCIFIFSFIEKKYGYKVGFIITLLISLIGFFYSRDAEFYSVYGVTLGLYLGFIFEEKYVKFNNSNKWISYILRPLIGVIIFIIIHYIFKFPIRNVTDESFLILLYRAFRYAFGTFIIIGVYPYLFKKFKF